MSQIDAARLITEAFLKEQFLFLQRQQRDRTVSFQEQIRDFKYIRKAVLKKESIPEFRGLQGAGSRIYIQCLREILPRHEWHYFARARRKALEQLVKECKLCLPGEGIFHTKRAGGLAADLGLLFRVPLVDGICLCAHFRNQGWEAAPDVFRQKLRSKIQNPLTKEVFTYSDLIRFRAAQLIQIIGEDL
jgi:CRISPR/Cas system-associated endonuclease Cas1